MYNQFVNKVTLLCRMVFESMVPEEERGKSPDKMNTVYGDALLRYGYSKISFTNT